MKKLWNKIYWKVDLWMLNNDWNCKRPVAYRFYDWVIPPNGDMGFLRWLDWPTRK